MAGKPVGWTCKQQQQQQQHKLNVCASGKCCSKVNSEQMYPYARSGNRQSAGRKAFKTLAAREQQAS
jgi:hypothetical protein